MDRAGAGVHTGVVALVAGFDLVDQELADGDGVHGTGVTVARAHVEGAGRDQ